MHFGLGTSFPGPRPLGTDADEGGQHETSDPKRPVFRDGDLAGLPEPEEDGDDGQSESDESDLSAASPSSAAAATAYGADGVRPTFRA